VHLAGIRAAAGFVLVIVVVIVVVIMFIGDSYCCL
jgi:Tfp pilus assembly protein PilX